MQALMCKAFGALSTLSIETVPSPTLQQGEVLVSVKAAAINFPDALVVQGLYQAKPPLPFSPGMELAGIITEIGAGVDGWAVGDRVMASVDHGAFSEECAVDANRMARLPANVSFSHGAAFIIAYGTALHALQNRAHTTPSDTVLILGAGGGVGIAAIQVARQLGAQVIAAASSLEKTQLSRKAGANHVIDYSNENLKERVKELTDGRGVNVVVDTTGGPNSETALRLLDWHGRYLVVGFAAGSIPQIRLNLALLKERDILGVFWGEAINRDYATYAKNMKLLSTWLEQGKICPLVSEEITLQDVPATLEQLYNRQGKGKIVVRM